jgi:hypothetical protein
MFACEFMIDNKIYIYVLCGMDKGRFIICITNINRKIVSNILYIYIRYSSE